MATGTIKFYNESKGFGFIVPENGGKDVFVHRSALEKAGIRMLNEGDRVNYEVENSNTQNDKINAVNISKA